jgi:hypothetical protein
MTKIEITQELIRIESELEELKTRVEKLPPARARGGKRPFAMLRGIWKKPGGITYEEIKACEIRLPGDGQ